MIHDEAQLTDRDAGGAAAPNRDAFRLESRSSLLERASAVADAGAKGTIALLALDGLGAVNTRFGRSFGDRVLLTFAGAVRQLLGSGTHMARWGGAEFVVLFESHGPASAAAELRELLSTLRSRPVPDPEGESFRLTFSAGLAAVRSDQDVDAAVATADRMLVAARRVGGGRIRHPDSAPAGSSRRILLAEDDEITSELLEHRLRMEGFDVASYPDGQAAYEAALATDDVALVISDVKMPRMDGFELLTRLRREPAYAETPIVMLTSMNREADIIRGLELGADDYVLKPFSPHELIARVLRLLNRDARAEVGGVA